MLKNTPKDGKLWNGLNWKTIGDGKPKYPNWGIEVNDTSVNGKLLFSPDGKNLKKKIRMSDAKLNDGSPQSLYFL